MMAEVTIDAPVIIETDEEKNGGQMRRFSNGNFDNQNRVVKREPRYLIASSGSCHDLCKHGFKSAPETKVGRSLQRRNSLDSTRKTAVIKKEIPDTSKKVTISLRRQTSSPAEIKYASEKHLRAPKPKTSSLVATQRLSRRHSEIFTSNDSEHLYMSSAGGSSGQTNSEKKVNKETGNSKIDKKKILARESFSLYSMSSTKRILSAQSEYVKKPKKVPSTLKKPKRIKEVGREQPRSENDIEKTLHVIGPYAKNQAVGLAKSRSFTSSLCSEGKGLAYGLCTVKASHSPPTENNTHASLFSIKSQSSTSSSPEAMHGADSAFDTDNSETENPITDLEVQNTRTLRIQVLSLEDKDCPSSHKLRFRRGTVIDVQSKNRSPSVLKFRHREALDKNQNDISDTRGRSLRRIASDGVLHQAKSETVKIALKHQDTETKEETWGFFDDVIEETANRLVQSRKSKVKALVGAFEAVLCRQDSKSMEMNCTQ